MTICPNCGGTDPERVEATLEGGILKRRWACPDCQHDFLARFERIDVDVREAYSGGCRTNGAGTSDWAADAPDPTDIVVDEAVEEDAVVTDCGAVEGSLTRVQVEAECHEGPVSVEAIDDPDGWTGVRLGWCSGPVALGTDLELGAARELAERIEVATVVAEQAERDTR